MYDTPIDWLPEPNTLDDTYARRGEHTLDWLARSTLPRAREYRRFLNHNLRVLPSAAQTQFIAALRERWHSAFFELVVARILQELGAVITIEDSTPLGSRPDFTAIFDDGSVVVEAVAPAFDGATGEEAKRRIPLLNILESNTPIGWHVEVWELPKLGPMDSKRQFERAVVKMLAVAPPVSETSEIEITKDLPSGRIHLRLRSSSNSSRKNRLAIEPPLTIIDSSEERIRYALKHKRRQVRGVEVPVLLALHASGISSDLGDFDRALFGRTYGRADSVGHVVETGFLSDGEFTKRREGPPTFSGVLAFLEVGPARVSEPVLYMHPRFEGNLPQAFSSLSRRWYDAETRTIQNAPSKEANWLAGLQFVNRYK